MNAEWNELLNRWGAPYQDLQIAFNPTKEEGVFTVKLWGRKIPTL
jgi:hypothetical protein